MRPFIQGLSEISDRYDCFIIDIFGVIHDGIRPFPHSLKTLEHLQNTGKTVCLLSNSPKRAEGAIAQMEEMGISRSLFQYTVTSGEATYKILRALPSAWGRSCWFIGSSYYSDLLVDQSFDISIRPEESSFILIVTIPGHDANVMNSLRKELKSAAQRNVPMLCANPDLVVNIGSEAVPCPGALAAEYEAMGGEVLYIGKPHLPVYEQCFALLRQPDKSRICAIGDSFHTDISGANNAGIDSVMNLVGIHWEEITDANGHLSQDKLSAMLSESTTRPSYVMAGMNW